MISICGLHKFFGDVEVLAGVDADLAEGKIACVVGPSGCGKSTLLRCINGLEPVDRGSIAVASFRVDGRLAGDSAALVRLRAAVGMVFQEFHLFPHMTALENISLAPRVVQRRERKDAEAQARTLLAEVGLANRANAYPAELSGGQKQRVAIARALAQPLSVLLLDEPTSALNPEMREEVRAVLRRVAKKSRLTMILVTHEMRLATELGDELWVMDKGRIVERGDPREIVARPTSEVARDFFARELGDADSDA